MNRILILFAALLAFIGSPLAAQDFPPLTGPVVDNADLIPALQEAELTNQLEALEAQTQRQLVVVTVPDLQGYDIADFGYQLGREWGLGDTERNDGALLIVAPNDRKVRIEVGYGLEGTLTDALSSVIIQNEILPQFRNNDYPGGIAAGTNAIITQLQLPADQAAQITLEAADSQKSRERSGGIPFGALIWLAFMFFFFILPVIRGGKRRRKYRKRRKGPWGKRRGKKRDDDDDDWDDDDDGWGRTARDIILWEVGSAVVRGAMGGGGSSWGGGGGGGFGGGFSGGGGSFGGGGASGGW